MSVVYEMKVPTGKYQKGGEEKTSWQTIGRVIETKNGSMMVKIDSMPTSVLDRDGNIVGWTGWANLFPPRPKDEYSNQPQKQAPTAPAEFDNDSALPF